MQIPFEIISTGSQGNAVVLNDNVLVDCGVSFKAIAPYVSKLKLVLLTHIHGDHFRPSTIRRLAEMRPTLRFCCCPWLVRPLVETGVPPRQIDVVDIGMQLRYGMCDVIPVMLAHNVPNCGYKIHFPKGRVFYATDTNNLNGITAKDYDLYMVEANYEDEEIQERIAAKKEEGVFSYERQVLENHLSKSKCDDFIYRNIGPTGVYVYLHCHSEKEANQSHE